MNDDDQDQSYQQPSFNWGNLKFNKCPQCNGDFTVGFEQVGDLLTHKCGFRIYEKTYKKIVADRVNRGLEKDREEENESSDSGF